MHNINIQEHKIIVIDADSDYGEAFTAKASDLGYRVDYFKNIRALGFIGNLSKYDAALVGENIGQMSPLEMADYFGKVLEKIPIVLMTSRDTTDDVPESINDCCPKSSGVEVIMQKALDAIDLSRKLAAKSANHPSDLSQGRNIS